MSLELAADDWLVFLPCCLLSGYVGCTCSVQIEGCVVLQPFHSQLMLAALSWNVPEIAVAGIVSDFVGRSRALQRRRFPFYHAKLESMCTTETYAVV